MGVSSRTIGTTGTGELTLGEFRIFCMWDAGLQRCGIQCGDGQVRCEGPHTKAAYLRHSLTICFFSLFLLFSISLSLSLCLLSIHLGILEFSDL